MRALRFAFAQTVVGASPWVDGSCAGDPLPPAAPPFFYILCQTSLLSLSIVIAFVLREYFWPH